MSEINCQFRSVINDQPVCQVVADIIERPLLECHTNDSACAYCLKCGIAPQTPNPVTASMSIHAANRSGDQAFVKEIVSRVSPALNKAPPPVTTCVRRGREIRRVACKPCQADSKTPVMVPVYTCPIHKECSLNNLGVFPKIKACATCDDRLEKPYQIEAKPVAPAVAAEARAIAARLPLLGNPQAQ